MMDGRITRLVCTATVVAGAGDDARSSASTESLLRTGLPAALPEALEHALGDDPTVYIARSLHCEASAGPRRVSRCTHSGRPRDSMADAVTRSATPIARKISMVRTLMPVARGSADSPARRSTSRDRVPARASSSAVVSPARPAPTQSNRRAIA